MDPEHSTNEPQITEQPAFLKNNGIMSYDEVKQRGLYYIKNRGINQNMAISNDDIKLLNAYKNNIFYYPALIGCALFGIKYITKKVELPSFFDNPLEPDDRAIYRKKFFDKFFKNKIIFIGILGSLCYYYVRYEVSKYYIYLKYENLVNAYVASRDAEYLKTLITDNENGLRKKNI